MEKKVPFTCRKCKLVQYVTVAPEILWPVDLPTMAEVEASLIHEAVLRAGNRNAAARLIGIGKTTIYRKERELEAQIERK
jgi:transcriptional regulator of acetoin/glycerol metabolism